jgi:hypothetical protein
VLAAIEAALRRIAANLRKTSARITDASTEGRVNKVFVHAVKIDVTPVIRGCVFEPKMRDVAPLVEDIRLCRNAGVFQPGPLRQLDVSQASALAG